MPLVITPVFMLMGMWVAAIFGAGAHAIITEHQKPTDESAVIYRIGVDFRTGETVNTCRDNSPAVEFEPR